MDFWSKPRTWVVIGVAALGLFVFYQMWVWYAERVEVRPGKFLVKINLWGKDLPEGEIVAPDSSYKGIQKDVLPEGRHFLNPLFYSYERVNILEIPVGQCAVLTHKAGKEIAPERKAKGEFLVERDAEGRIHERGTVREVLLPGRHRLNPHVYSYELVPLTKVSANQVGVRILRWGKDPSELPERKSKYVVPEGYRGVQEKLMPPGDYYLNPYVEKVVPVDIDLHQVEFADISFPSRDGFNIQPHVRVSYKVLPEKAPELFVMLCDNGKLYQLDRTPKDQMENPILQKFVLPLIRGWVRIEGSKYEARDYVSQQKEQNLAEVVAASKGMIPTFGGAIWGQVASSLAVAFLGQKGAINPREQLRKVLEEKVKPQCEEVGVMIESITVAELEMNKDTQKLADKELQKLADLIFQRETTTAARAKNADLVLQAKSEQEKQGKEALRERSSKMVDAKRDLEVAKTLAKQQKEVEEAKLKNELKSAQTRLEAAREQAKATLTRGKAEAAIITAQNEAEVAGLKTAVAGFPTAEQFAQYHMLTKLSPTLSEIFASDTSEFAKLFSNYMTGSKKSVSVVPKGTAEAKK
jgi:regulator of protease activity HflC (stomatin/prohibitin superfamily)